MKKKKHSKLLILGSGPAGYTAAIYASRANLKPVLITGREKGGQLINTNQIENWPGDPKTITGSKLMERMHIHAKKFGTNIIHDHVTKVNFKKKPFYLKSKNYKYTFNALIIATGSVPKSIGIHNEKNYQGKGISTCAICDGFFYKNKKIAVIGGGNTAVEEALYLSKIAKEVHLIHRSNNFKAEKILIKEIINKSKYSNIILHKNHILKEIRGNNKKITGIYIQKIDTNIKKYLEISGIFIAIGYNPNTSLFINQLKLEDGYIYTNKSKKNNITSTSVPGIFAAGDVTDNQYRQAITSAGTGCMAALDAEKYLNKLFFL
ncbi:Thioredoxin reductase [Candidatus Westeberhardia cardiocondylae]|uniref:Thioredoxin reductase n=1 Tax=Candidatus Westeberhardia cardiocondylae TaxID=1594731 RepID=A0A0H5BX36_9ENTR|nr:thioredoxin-disulfide reductase [Candidatus Westeberhardia cardiocondylae]CEN32159.1 Thioredoxin reductase [Candidatus Westeberhardia cardiocondylae]